MFSTARKTALPALLPLILILCLAAACDSGSGGKDAYSVIFKLDASCNYIGDYLLEFKAPYSRAFSGAFTASKATAALEDFPAGEQQTLITLNGEAPYLYDTRLDSAWGAVATYTATCDEVSPKPFLSLDQADSVFALSVPEECNWFPRGEWYEVVQAGPSGDQEALQLLYSGNPNEQHRRMIHMFRNGENDEIGVRTFMLRMTDANGKTYDFRYEFSTAEKHLYSYVISCDPAAVKFDAILYIDGEEYIAPSDGDTDGDGETADGDGGEADIEGADGDDSESPDGDDTEDDTAENFEESDGDEPDGDMSGDGDAEAEVEPEEDVQVCDITETPEYSWGFFARDNFLKDESTPSELAYIAETDNPAFIDVQEYTRLDAGEVGHELVLSLDVETTYMYSILVKYVKGVNWGMVELYLDDSTEPLEIQSGGTAHDLHVVSTGSYDVALPSNYIVYSPVCLNYGSHRLRFRVSGKNSNSEGYTIGVYHLNSVLHQD